MIEVSEFGMRPKPFDRRFSCLMAFYAKENAEYLDLSLKSIFDQVWTPNEVVLLQDGPIGENLKEVVKKWSDKLPIKYHVFEKPIGLGKALHLGLEMCKYDLVARMDADDICLPHRFEKQVQFMLNNPGIDVIGTWCEDIDQAGMVVGARKYPTDPQEIHRLIWSCPIVHPTVMMRKKAIIEVGSYRLDLERRQDFELWIRAAVSGVTFANIPEFLLKYRVSDEYFTKNTLKSGWVQTKSAFVNLPKLKAKPFAYLAVWLPTVRAILPTSAGKFLHQLFSFIDPRKK